LLNSTEFTVWDRPWAPNEEARGPCCNESEDRTELGRLRYPGEPERERQKRNPMLKESVASEGVFGLDWRERAKLLRQLVDWQRESRDVPFCAQLMVVTHADAIRGIIGKEYKLNDNATKASAGLETSIVTTPLGQDRDKARIWALDGEQLGLTSLIIRLGKDIQIRQPV
jgi:hypothetical protein